ncbi:unnamed protein product, partial [Iphiclides podalirius]
MLPLISLVFNIAVAKSLNKLPEVGGNYSWDTHLGYAHVRRSCSSTDKICEGGGADVCAMRMAGGVRQHVHYENSCYLFMSNMCENPGQEFSIVSSGSCEHYKDSRRNSPVANKNATVDIKSMPGSTAKPAARSGTMSTLYDVDSAFDFHLCPMSCPDTYEPICLSVNRGYGAYFKFYTFINHCAGDLYYCKHWQEFSPPPNEDENVVSSKLGWSFCGSSRYLQFARFAEVSSSMGHYGWLAGNYKYSHIMEPHERIKGYG